MNIKLIYLFALLPIFNIAAHGAMGTGEDEAWGSGGSNIIPKELDSISDNNRSDLASLANTPDTVLYGYPSNNEITTPLVTIDNAQRSNKRISTIAALKTDIDDVARKKIEAHKEYRKAGYPLLKLRKNAELTGLSMHGRALRKKYLDLDQEYNDLKKELAHLRALLTTGE